MLHLSGHRYRGHNQTCLVPKATLLHAAWPADNKAVSDCQCYQSSKIVLVLTFQKAYHQDERHGRKTANPSEFQRYLGLSGTSWPVQMRQNNCHVNLQTKNVWQATETLMKGTECRHNKGIIRTVSIELCRFNSDRNWLIIKQIYIALFQCELL